MKLRSILLLVILAGGIAYIAFSRGEKSSANAVQGVAAQDPNLPRIPVLVELFTSEGCSSCPPADEYVAELLRSQPIPGAEVILLKQHVDYWNGRNWRDPFSSSQFTARQSRYADFFGNDTVYTPQMIVDGTQEFVGANRRRAQAAISAAAKSPKPAMGLEISPGAVGEVTVRVKIPALAMLPAGAPAELFLAVTEGGITSQIRGGENSGRTIVHESVVRSLEPVATLRDAAAPAVREFKVQISAEWPRQNLRLVAFIQERGTRRVLAASSIAL